MSNVSDRVQEVLTGNCARCGRALPAPKAEKPSTYFAQQLKRNRFALCVLGVLMSLVTAGIAIRCELAYLSEPEGTIAVSATFVVLVAVVVGIIKYDIDCTFELKP